MWEYIRTIIISIISALVAYLDPVAGNLQSLMGLFFLNFIVGYTTGMLKNGESFQMRKFMMCFVWAGCILSLICFFYFIGERNGNKDETLEFVRWVSIIAIWAFGCNILKNLRHLSYGYGVYYIFFDTLYTGVSLEFIKRIPFLTKKAKQYYDYEDDNKPIDDSADC